MPLTLRRLRSLLYPPTPPSALFSSLLFSVLFSCSTRLLSLLLVVGACSLSISCLRPVNCFLPIPAHTSSPLSLFPLHSLLIALPRHLHLSLSHCLPSLFPLLILLPSLHLLSFNSAISQWVDFPLCISIVWITVLSLGFAASAADFQSSSMC